MSQIINGQEYLTAKELSERLDKTIEASKETLRAELRQSQRNHSSATYV